MNDHWTYDPDAWHPAVAGIAAGAVAAIVAGVLSAILRSPDEIVANSLTVVLTSLALGLVAGLLWRRLRASSRAMLAFGIAMAAGWFVAMLAVTIVDQVVLSNLIPYAAPLAAVIFISLGFLIPVFARVTVSPWLAAVPVVIALAIGIGLFGRGNVASGELSLDDLDPVTTTTADTAVTTTTGAAGGDSTSTTVTGTTAPGELSGTVSIPGDLADTYTVASGRATYSVEERLRGLATVGVGETTVISGTIAPAGTFEFTIDLQSFESDQANRDSRVRGWFSEFPQGTFAGSEFTLPSSATVGEVVAFPVTGEMTVNGITLPATWDVEARVEVDGSLSVTGETFIVLSDYDIPVVTGGLIEMEDGATLEVLFSAAPAP
jgi:polyisoprenoid-binding protein YceI